MVGEDDRMAVRSPRGGLWHHWVVAREHWPRDESPGTVEHSADSMPGTADIEAWSIDGLT